MTLSRKNNYVNINRMKRLLIAAIFLALGGCQSLGLAGSTGSPEREEYEGIPTLVAVPDGVREVWREFTGDLGEELSFEMDSFRAWWRQNQPEAR